MFVKCISTNIPQLCCFSYDQENSAHSEYLKKNEFVEDWKVQSTIIVVEEWLLLRNKGAAAP
jgi:hypothetical protein